MGESLRLQVVTPDGAVVDQIVSEVTAVSRVGQFCVLPGHRPILAAIRPGVLRFVNDDGAHVYVADTGFFEGGVSRANVVTQRCVSISDLDGTQIAKEISTLTDQLAENSTDQSIVSRLEFLFACKDALS